MYRKPACPKPPIASGRDALAEAAKKYKLEEKLDTGSFGQVYRGTMTDGTAVAIKAFHQGSAGNQEANEEAAIADLVRHPAVVRLLDAFLQKERVHLVYELARQDLYRFLKASAKPLETERIRITSLQILTALVHIHLCGLVHTDVKPANILVRSTSPWACLLGDVGSAVEVRLASL